ncbi:MAG: hypothetical protein FJ387_13220 [Verrucomicrobia bacterium]|nr:hypothetical protein [Verrucomicrobiota bacterium]
MNFDESFEAVTGHSPFRWQRRLFKRLASGSVPRRCDLPTGLGKTSIIPIWALGLANEPASSSPSSRLPRRLVYIVDRRVVVDQTTDEVEALLAEFMQWTATPDAPELQPLAKNFMTANCAGGGEPFTVSTLRGQHADNRRWLEDPTRPAVIVGTVDMLGSRLLFSGYGGLGRYSRSLHAGFKGGVVEDSDKRVADVVDANRFRRVVLRPSEHGWEATELREEASGQPFGLYESLADAKRKLAPALGPGVKLLHISGGDTESDLDSEELPEPGQRTPP